MSCPLFRPPPALSFLRFLPEFPPSPSCSIHLTEHCALLPALPLTQPIDLLFKWLSNCSTRVTPRQPSPLLFIFPLPSVLPHPPFLSLCLPCSLSSCHERQWNITVMLRGDASTRSEEHTLCFWCFLRAERTPPPPPSVLLVRYWRFGVSSQGGNEGAN